VALALLVAIWGVFLIVTFVRKHADFRADSSIGAFQRQLQVLRRNSEQIDGVVPPVSSAPSAGYPSARVISSISSRNQPQPDTYRDDYAEPRYAGRHAAQGTTRRARQDPFFRPEACARRRDVLLILVTALASTGIIAIIPAARMVLVATAIAGFALLVYLVTLVRLRTLAHERQSKLRYMPAPEKAPVFADRRVIAR
jgi:hypothetical protein